MNPKKKAIKHIKEYYPEFKAIKSNINIQSIDIAIQEQSKLLLTYFKEALDNLNKSELKEYIKDLERRYVR